MSGKATKRKQNRKNNATWFSVCCLNSLLFICIYEKVDEGVCIGEVVCEVALHTIKQIEAAYKEGEIR